MDATFRSPSFLQCSSEGGKAQLARLWTHQERRKTGGILSGEVHVCVNQVLSRFGVNGLHCHPFSADLPPGSFELIRMPTTVEVERVDHDRQKVSPIGRHDLLIWFRLRTGTASQLAP